MSESSSSTVRSGGIGFAGLLTVLFIGLKLTGHITWSWWWVLSPLWISALLTIGILILFLLGFLLATWWVSRKAKTDSQRLLDELNIRRKR